LLENYHIFIKIYCEYCYPEIYNKYNKNIRMEVSFEMPNENTTKNNSQELGKLEKPEAAKFKKGRKLIFVPLLFAPSENEAEVENLYKKYWQQVSEQINNLESKLSDITKIYHEYICLDGEDGIKEIDRMGAGTHEIIKPLVRKGAMVMAAESAELMSEFMDWNRCLSSRITNQKVLTKLVEFYNEALKNREEWIGKSVDLTLGDDEFGLLFMRENNKVQFPSDIEVFYVAPPSLDEIKRWVREKRSTPPSPVGPEEKPEEKKMAARKTAGKKTKAESGTKKAAAKKPASKKITEKKEK
jgi:hypothetical protein